MSQKVLLDGVTDAVTPGLAPTGVKKDDKKNSKRKGRSRDFNQDKAKAAEADRFNLLAAKWELTDFERKIGDDMFTGPVSKPSRTVAITCNDAIPVLVQATVDHLTAARVVLPENAVATLTSVVRLQVKTREVIARRGTPMQQAEDRTTSGIERCAKWFTRAPHAIAFYLSNIGKIKYRDQMIYPVSDVANPTTPTVPGATRTNHTNAEGDVAFVTLAQGAPAYTDPLVDYMVANPNAITNIAYRHVPADDIDVLTGQYTLILEAIDRKMSYMVSEVDFKECIGTTAQLVGTTQVAGGLYTASSAVELVDHMVAVGAGCRLGRGSNDFYHTVDNAHLTRQCYPNSYFNFIQRKPKVT